MMSNSTRRAFLQQWAQGAAAISLAGPLPKMLQGATEKANLDGDRVLVVLQLSGGNDGLNTLVPFGDDAYYENRFTLAIKRGQVLKIDDYRGFHPSLRGFSDLYENRQLAVLQGIGYPQPNRSHFESMDLWHSAHQMDAEPIRGWLGRAVDQAWESADLPALHLGGEAQPLALRREQRPIPSIRSIDNFRLDVLGDAAARRRLMPLLDTPRKSDNGLLAYVQQSAQVAVEASQKLREATAGGRSGRGYPGTQLGRNLSTIAQLIGSGLKTRIYYATLGGFDTHSNQAQSHAALLTELGSAVAAFMRDLADQGNHERVCLFTFSEFGRRVRENASRGTDHGAAAPAFVVGGGVQGGLYGKYPSLTDLDQGDLKYNLDYRSVYADLLGNWLDIQPAEVLGQSFQPPGLFG